MGNRIFVAVVVLLWTGTMSWLMVARILPPLFQGDPPLPAQRLETDPNCWQIELAGKQVGEAFSQAVPGAFGTTEVHSRVVLKGVELRKLWPFQVGSLIHGLNTIRMDTRTRLTLDTLGSLTSFDTKVKLMDVPLVLNVRGRVEGPELLVTLQSGETRQDLRFPVPRGSILANDLLLPESQFPGLTVGRRWRQEAFSPFKTSMEIVQAEVVAEDVLEFRGKRQNARRIEFRSLSSAGVAADKTLRSIVWVSGDGTVLRQDLQLMSVSLRFERCTEPELIQRAREMLDLKNHATVVPQTNSL